jgi:hypothetical protein
MSRPKVDALIKPKESKVDNMVEKIPTKNNPASPGGSSVNANSG